MYISCYKSLFPAKIGSPNLSSAKIQPKLHMSIGKEYPVPMMISGAL